MLIHGHTRLCIVKTKKGTYNIYKFYCVPKNRNKIVVVHFENE